MFVSSIVAPLLFALTILKDFKTTKSKKILIKNAFFASIIAIFIGTLFSFLNYHTLVMRQIWKGYPGQNNNKN